MVSTGLHILGSGLAFLGWVGEILMCALPTWRVTAFIGSKIVTAEVMWEGIWLSCIVQSTGDMQCDDYDSILALPSDVQAARALTITAVVVGMLGLLMALLGGKCTNFIKSEAGKAGVRVAAGVVLMLSSILCLVPITWTGSMIIQDFYNPLINDAQRRELGDALYVGWAAGLVMLIGGALLCTTCPPREGTHHAMPLQYQLVKTPILSSQQSDYLPCHRPPSPCSLTPSKTYI